MKKQYKISIVIILISIGFFLTSPIQADPPGMPGSHGTNGDQPPGGGAPIGGGVFILSSLALAYGLGKKKVSYQVLNE